MDICPNGSPISPLSFLLLQAAQPAARVFDGEGRELNDPTDLVANSTVYVSAGEDFTSESIFRLPSTLSAKRTLR